MEQKIFKLSGSEEIILTAILELLDNDSSADAVKVIDLIEYLKSNHNKEYARTTVVTFLARLEAKNAVSTYRKGRFLYVVPKYNRKEYTNFLINYIVGLFYSGNRDEFLHDISSDGN